MLTNQFILIVSDDVRIRVVPIDELTIFVQQANPILCRFDVAKPSFDLLFGTLTCNRLFDAVRQYFVLFGAAGFLKVLSDPGRDGFASDLLASFTVKE